MAWFSHLILSNVILQICYLEFASSGLGGENDVSTVKKGRWNKKVWETLA